MIRVALLVERLLKNADRIVVAKRFGIAARGAVGRHLPVLDALRGGDQRRVERFTAFGIVEPAACVLDERGHRTAWNGARRLIELFEQQAEPLDLNLCFRMMLFERTLQARGRRAARHDRQLGGQLLLGVHEVVKLGRVQIAERDGTHNVVRIA